MTLRALIEDGSTRIRETTLAEHNAMIGRIAYLYQTGTVPVTLSVVSSGGNISPNMTDTRYKSGTAAQNTSGAWPAVTVMPPEGSTGEPQLVTGVTYDKISQTTTSVPAFTNSDYQSLAVKPVLYDGANTIQEMTYTQVLQYFIDPVVLAMQQTTNTTDAAGGSYFISTSVNVSGSANLGTVFVDTSANAAGYFDYNIGPAGTTQDVSTSTPYYLHKVNSSIINQGFGYRTPLMIDYSQSSRLSQTPAGLRHMTYTEFDNLFSPLVKHAISTEAGYRVSYNINGSGTRQGTVIANRQMVGVNGLYTTFEKTADDYRAQQFPNGTIVNLNEWELKLERT